MESRDDSYAVGSVLFGKYEVLELLGRGGMAEVYKALSVGVAGFSRPVVIKRILPHLAANRQFVEMFVKEASIAASLDHPNIVQVYDLGRHETELFMVLEFVPGTNLGVLIEHFANQGKPVPHQVVAYVGVDVCKALECAHGHLDPTGAKAPVIHRDVSPQNVLLSVAGHVKLADFGLATPIGAARVTMPGIIKGKLGYMSPEQARGARVLDTRSDLFSLGIVLYEALTGKRLFAGRAPADTIRRVRDAVVPHLSSVAPGVPPVLCDLVHALLARDPDDRPPVAKDVRRVLSGYLRAVTPPIDATTLSRVVRQVVVAGGGAGEEAPARAVEASHAPETGRPAEVAADSATFDEDGRATLFQAPSNGSASSVEEDVRDTTPADPEDLRDTAPPEPESEEGGEKAAPEAPPARPKSGTVPAAGSSADSPVIIARVVTVGGPGPGSNTGT